MINNQLTGVSKKYNELVNDNLVNIYKDVTGLDIEKFREWVKEEVAKRKEDAVKNEKKFDTSYESEAYIEDKTKESFQIALDAYKKDNNIDITFEETFDAEGNAILVFGVTKVVKTYTVAIDFSYDLTIWEAVEEIKENI